MAHLSEESRELTGSATVRAEVPAFVGRGEVLRAVVGAVTAPRPAVVLIEGEAGIGKTRLLNEALAACGDRVVLTAACPPLRDPFPLGPVVDGLRRLRPRGNALGLSPLGGALRPLFPEWTDDLPPALEALDDPRETRHRLLRALTELIERLGVEVLVLEDAHWADTATLEWLLTLTSAKATAQPARSVVVTYRPLDVPRGSLLLRLTSRTPAAHDKLRIELEPLEVGQVRELVGSMLDTDAVSEQFAEFLHDRTDGIPLALEETIQLMRDRHDIIHQDGSWTRRVLGELDVPPTVRDSVLERLDRLDPDSRATLYAAAIVAHPADEALLSAVAELDPPASRRGVAGSLAAGLLRESDGGQLVFRHALDAKAVSAAIPVSEQWRLHRNAAELLRVVDPLPVVRLARHFREANHTEAWCLYAEASADLALEAGDDDTAAQTLIELLTTAEHPAERIARLALKLGTASVSGSTPLGETGTRSRDALLGALDHPGLSANDSGEIRLLLGRLLFRLGEIGAGRGEIESALPNLNHRPELAARAMLHLAWPWTRTTPVSAHRMWLERATALYEYIASPDEQLVFATNRVAALLQLGEEAGWEEARGIPVSASTRLGRQTIVRAQLNVAEDAIVWGRYEDVPWRLSLAEGLVQDTRFERVMDAPRIVRALLAWHTGRWEGLTEITASLAASEKADLSDQLTARLVHGLLAMAKGSRSQAERDLAEVKHSLTARGRVEPAIFPSAGLARMLLADGRVDEALALTEQDMAVIAGKGTWIWAADVAPVHMEGLISAGLPAAAEALLTDFAEGLVGRNAPAPATALILGRGMAADARGNTAEAARLFAEAATSWASLPRPYDELLTHERRARCLLGARDQDEAIDLLVDVQRRLRDLGATWDADRIAHTLRQHGHEVVRTWRRGRRGYGDHLSPRELQVVELVARGMTNKQIADSLFISPKTVTQHLTASMRKLDVSSRTALAMAASDAGMLSADT